MKCPKFGFELNDSLKKSYCKNCDWNCSGTITQSWFTSLKIEVTKEQKVAKNTSSEHKIELLVCPSCHVKSLFLFPDNIHVECLNHKCKIQGIIVKDGEDTYIHYESLS